MYALVWTARFTRSAKKFTQREAGLRPKFAKVLRDLENDPFQPHLKFHHLGGELTAIQAVSINHSYRITLTLIVSAKEIALLDVGSHGEVCR